MVYIQVEAILEIPELIADFQIAELLLFNRAREGTGSNLQELEELICVDLFLSCTPCLRASRRRMNMEGMTL